MMLAGVRPTIRFASAPTARTRLVFASIATTDGSLMTMPRSRTWTSVLAVPRSIPMSREEEAEEAIEHGCGRSFAMLGSGRALRLSGAGGSRARGVRRRSPSSIPVTPGRAGTRAARVASADVTYEELLELPADSRTSR